MSDLIPCQPTPGLQHSGATEATASATIAAKAIAYGMPSRRVDGNDVLAVTRVVEDALDRARNGDQAEVDAWLKKDPIKRYRTFLEEQGLWDEAQEEDLQDELSGQIKKAKIEAEAAQPIAFDTMITDVFAEIDPRLQEHYDDEFDG